MVVRLGVLGFTQGGESYRPGWLLLTSAENPSEADGLLLLLGNSAENYRLLMTRFHSVNTIELIIRVMPIGLVVLL